MIDPPETVSTTSRRVFCDGASDIRGGAALGHPRVWLEIDASGYVDCGYCDRRFVLDSGPGESGRTAAGAGSLGTPPTPGIAVAERARA